MKLNRDLIERLAKGEIQLKNTNSDVKKLETVLNAVEPNFCASYKSNFYMCLRQNEIIGQSIPFWNLQAFTTEQFFESVPDVGNTSETRELAKQLFSDKMRAGALPTHSCMETAIRDAKEFIKLLNENGL